MKNSKYTFIIFLFPLFVYSQDSLKFSEAYLLSLSNDSQLKSKKFQLESAQETIEQAKAGLYPNVSFSSSVGKRKYEYTEETEPNIYNYKDYSIMASQPLFDLNNSNKIDIAETDYISSKYEYEASEQKNGFDIMLQYIEIARDTQNIELLKTQKHYHEEKIKEVNEKLKVGFANKIDLFDIQDKLKSIDLELTTKTKQINIKKTYLENRLNTKLFGLYKFKIENILKNHAILDKDELQKSLLLTPDVKSVENTVLSAHTKIRAARDEYYPVVDFNVNLKQINSYDRNDRKYDYQAFVRLILPLYDGGIRESSIKEKSLLLKASQENYNYKVQKLQNDFDIQWEDFEHNISNLELLKSTEETTALRYEFIEEAFNYGKKSYIDLLEAKAKQFKVKEDIINATHNLLKSHLILLVVTGNFNKESINTVENTYFESIN